MSVANHCHNSRDDCVGSLSNCPVLAETGRQSMNVANARRVLDSSCGTRIRITPNVVFPLEQGYGKFRNL